MSYHQHGPPILRSAQPDGRTTVYVGASFVIYATQEDALHGVRGTTCYNVPQVAALLGISEKGVYELARRGTMPTTAYWGKMALFDAEAVLEAARRRGRIR